MQIEKAPQQICAEIGQNSIAIHYGKEAADMAKQGPTQSMLVVCDKVTATSGKGEASTLACENCKFTMPNGITGEASSIAFDSASGLLTLSGSEETPVKLSMTNGGTFSITTKAEITLDANALSPAAMPASLTLGSRY